MSPRLFTLTAASLAVLCAAPIATAASVPLRSQAELDRYLSATPLVVTPLAPLSPGGRRRFLASLMWGSRGLASMSTDDAAHELTHPQIMRLFALFGAEAYADNLGLSTQERAHLEREHAEDASARGCSVESCPESAIEQRYDTLMLHRQGSSDPALRYGDLFAQEQRPERLRAASTTDLRLLERAAAYAAAIAPDHAHLADLAADLAEMQRRGLAVDDDYAGLYKALVISRQFTEADALAKRHPGLDTGALPVLLPGPLLPPGQPTALMVNAQGHGMTRQAIGLSASWRLVVVAACHFSEDAARDISADPQLRRLFARHAIWLADQGESFAAAAEWNRRFPDQPIRIAWQNREWPMLDNWAMPTFYLFHQGRIVDRWSGWPPGTGIAALRTHLRANGMLP